MPFAGMKRENELPKRKQGARNCEEKESINGMQSTMTSANPIARSKTKQRQGGGKKDKETRKHTHGGANTSIEKEEKWKRNAQMKGENTKRANRSEIKRQ